MTDTDDNYVSVPYWYTLGDEEKSGELTISKPESGNASSVHLLVAEEIARQLKELNKVVVYEGRQITAGWVERKFSLSSKVTVTAQAWSEPFQVSVYDAV